VAGTTGEKKLDENVTSTDVMRAKVENRRQPKENKDRYKDV